MTDRRWDLAGAAGGVLFAVLAVVGLLLVRLPGGEDRNRDVADHFADDGNRILGYVAVFLLALAGVAFLVFVAALWERLRRAAPTPSGLHVVAAGAAVLFVAMLFLTAASVGSVAAIVEQGGEDAYGPDVARTAWIGTLAFVICGGFAASAFVAATSALILRSGVVPRWVAWAGFVAAVVLLGSVIFLPMIVLPLWVVATSVALITDAGRRTVARTASGYTAA